MNMGNSLIIIGGICALVAAVAIPYGFYLKSNEPKISIENVNGDVVLSQNQSGGITAHTVTINDKTKKRSINKSIDVIVNELKKYPIAAYRLHYSSSDPEATDLANDIDEILKKANWQRIDPIQRIAGPSLPKGVTIFMLKKAEPMVTLNNQLWTALNNKGVEGQILQDIDNIFKIHGWPPVELPNGRDGVVIFIGPNQED